MPGMQVKKIEKIMQDTLQAIQSGKEQICDIGESIQREVKNVEDELRDVREQVGLTIDEVERLGQEVKKARTRLVEVSRDFESYSESDIKDAYDVANNLQMKLIQMQEREKQLRLRRNQLERSQQNLKQTQAKAESLVTRVSIVMDFLSGNLQQISGSLDDLYQQQMLGVKIIRAQEEERRRVARDIHDGPAQSMANIALRAEFCEKMMEIDPAKLRQELREFKSLAQANVQELRRVIFDLRPMALDDLGIIPTLRRYLNDFEERNKMAVELIVFGKEQRLRPEHEITVFRVVQEALNNAWKHAQADKVWVKLETALEQVTVVIKDDGCGFELEKVLEDQERSSYGLLGMRERLLLLKGSFKITSAPGRGTTVIAQLPLA